MIKPDHKNVEQNVNSIKVDAEPPKTKNSTSTPTPKTPDSIEGVIDFTLLNQAENILNCLLNTHGSNTDLIFGKALSQEEITKKYHNWAERNNLLKKELPVTTQKQDRSISSRKTSVLSCLPELQFSTDILCSAKFLTNGPQRKNNKPENRSYKLIVRSDPENDLSNDNLFVREHSFDALLDHELGTHFFRMLNEGLQPWYSDRKKFNISESRSYDMLKAEEGLAAIHTVLKMPTNHLWFPSILYVTGVYYKCSNFDTFDTVNKLGKFCSNKEFCYRLVKRAAKGLTNHDQAYLIGAVEILENRKTIDFEGLMCGRLSFDELDRVKRVTRKFGIRLPDFMKDLRRYRKRLDDIAKVNFID
jgi:hypothetical protein